MVLEVFPEKRLVGEIQVVGDLLDAHRGVFQQVFGFEHHIVVDPLHGRAPAGLADDRREVFGRQVQLAGIETDRTLLHVMPGQHPHELVEILLVAAARRGVRRPRLDMPGDDPADLVGQCPDHRTYDLGGVGAGKLL